MVPSLIQKVGALSKERYGENEAGIVLKKSVLIIASCSEPLQETYILLFLYHLRFTVFQSLCVWSNLNINALSFAIHSDGNVFHLYSIVFRPPLHLSIDA